MKALLTFSMLTITATCFAQTSQPTLVEYVKMMEQYEQEALFYYNENWKLFREEALKQGHISSYAILTIDDSGDYDIMLITSFDSKEQHEAAEENFGKIIKEQRPNGPKLLNEITPNLFRENVKVENGNAIGIGASGS